MNYSNLSRRPSRDFSRKTKQEWSVGNNIKVGFLTLKITGTGEYTSQQGHIVYKLSSLDGARRYEFSPHEGLKKIIE